MQDDKYVILLIDDNPDILKTLTLLLEANQYKVAQAGSAKEGLEMFETTQPDLVIVDLMMEDIDAGKNFAQAIKSKADAPPVYLLSSAGDEMYQSFNYSELGFSGVIQKPYKSEELLKIIQSSLKS